MTKAGHRGSPLFVLKLYLFSNLLSLWNGKLQLAGNLLFCERNCDCAVGFIDEDDAGGHHDGHVAAKVLRAANALDFH